MCGITGYLQFNRSHGTLESELKAAVSTLNLRGPDNQTAITFQSVGLGHARLSIIDLASVANQPMKDHSGRYSIVFNGEIFNHQQLRQELGIQVKTSSDTEVLLEAYVRLKEKCLEKLDGFFAFAIYDHLEHSYFLARDRYGMKPLVYSHTQDGFYFASELKALAKFPIEKNINQESMQAFFQLSYIPAPNSIFKEISKLMPGHYLKVTDGKVTQHSYYSLKVKSPLRDDYEAAKKDLFSLVKNAVHGWMISDAPLGAFLSGGVDSSIVVALASQEVSNLSTFSVSFPDSPFHDESQFAQIVAKKYKTNHHVIPITQKDLFSSVDKVLDYLDEPFADSSAIPSYALCEAVSKHVKVALSGDGADEVFGGYEKYKGEFLARKFQWLSPLGISILPISSLLPSSRDSKFLNQVRKGNKFFKGISLSKEERYWEWCGFNSSKDLKNILKNPALSHQWKKGIFPNETRYIEGLNQNFFKDTLLVLPGDMLTKVDMMSMANSLEVRPVLLDHKVVDFAFSLPSHFKVTQKNKKKILIDTFKHLLPEEVYNRPKHGFSVELMPFFRNHFWDKINDVYLNDQFIKEQGLFNLHGIQELKKSIRSGKNQDIQALVWSLITFQNFYLKFKVGNR